MIPDYSYSCAELRVRESRIITDEALQRSGITEAELLRMLSDLGFGASGAESVDGLIKAELTSVRALMKSMLPEELYALLLLDTDSHNLKVLLKSAVMGSDRSELLLEETVYDTEIAAACASGGEFSLLSEHIASVLNPAYDAGELVSPFDISTACDRAFFGQKAIYAKKAPEVIRRSAMLEADTVNYLSFRRARAISLAPELFEKTLVPGGSMPTERLSFAYQSGDDDLSALSFGYDCHEAYLMADRREDPSVYAASRVLMLEAEKLLEPYRYDTDTPYPIFLFFRKKQNEALILRRALVSAGEM